MASLGRQVLALAAIAAISAGGYMALDRFEPAEAAIGKSERPPPGVVAREASTGVIERSVSAVGSGIAFRAVELKMISSGRVAEINFEGGDRVAAGDVLVRLDEDGAKAALAEAEADLVEAEQNYARAETLRKQDRVADSALDGARAALKRARARVDLAADILAKRTLRAPFPGVVGFRQVDIGSSVDSDTVIATLDDLSAISVDFMVPERYFDDVAVGAAVRAETQIFPGEVFEGEVIGIGRRIDLVSRSFEVRARIANSDNRLPSGTFLRVTLVFDDRPGVLIPEEAVVAQGDGAHVFVVRDGRVEQREVRVGTRLPGQVEILEGIAAGEAVVVRGVQKVRDGQAVTLLPEAAAAAT